MRTRNLLLMSAFLACFFMAAFAQEDITPNRYKFADLPVGKFVIDEVNAGANPPAGWAAVAAGYDNGFVALCGGPAVFTSKDVPAFVGFQEGTNIVDLGGDVGKVLTIKGPQSNLEAGTAMGSGYTGQWCNLNFYFDEDMTPVNEDLRLRMVFSIYENEISSTGSLLSKFYTSTAQNNTFPMHTDDQVNIFPSDFFMALDEEGDPIEDDDGYPMYDPTKWMIHEFDVKVPDAEGNPTRLKIEFDAGRLVNGTLFIKEVQLVKGASGEPVQRELVTYNPVMSSVKSVKKETIQFAVNGNTVTLFGLDNNSPVSIYNFAGQQVNSMVSNSDELSVELSSGLYIVHAAGKTAKVLVK